MSDKRVLIAAVTFCIVSCCCACVVRFDIKPELSVLDYSGLSKLAPQPSGFAIEAPVTTDGSIEKGLTVR